MVNAPNTNTDDDVNLMEILEKLWLSRWVLIFFLTAAIAIGAIFVHYNTVQTINHKVIIPYFVNIYAPHHEQICSKDISCLQRLGAKQIINFAGGGFSNNDEIQSLIAYPTVLLPSSEYKKLLSSLREKINAHVLNEANIEISIIRSVMIEHVIPWDSIAKNLINAKRIIRQIHEGQDVVVFGNPTIQTTTLVSPRPVSVMILAILSGCIFGTFYVLFRDALLRRVQKSGVSNSP